jgi:hypothetical protein
VVAIRIKKPEQAPEFGIDAQGNLVAFVHGPYTRCFRTVAGGERRRRDRPSRQDLSPARAALNSGFTFQMKRATQRLAWLSFA